LVGWDKPITVIGNSDTGLRSLRPYRCVIQVRIIDHQHAEKTDECKELVGLKLSVVAEEGEDSEEVGGARTGTRHDPLKLHVPGVNALDVFSICCMGSAAAEHIKPNGLGWIDRDCRCKTCPLRATR